MSASNRRWRVAAMPTEHLETSHFELETVDLPEVPDGQVRCRVLWISIDAAQRAWFQGATYRSAIQVGDTMPAFAIGQVVESRSDDFAVGDIVTGHLGWQDYAVVEPDDLQRLVPTKKLSYYLSVLGITGLTAYFGLLDVGRGQGRGDRRRLGGRRRHGRTRRADRQAAADVVSSASVAARRSRSGSPPSSGSTRRSAIATTTSASR